MVDKSYACRNYYPFQTVAMEENDLFDLAAVRQNAGFEDRALSECGFFYQSYAVGNNYVFDVTCGKCSFADCCDRAVIWNFAFAAARNESLCFFSMRQFPFPL